MKNPFSVISWGNNSWTGTGINNPWNSPTFNQLADKAWKSQNFFKGTLGARRISKHAWATSKDLINSVKNNAETYVESPTSNRWVTKDGIEYLEPHKGATRQQAASTAIESIIIDKNTSRNSSWGTDYKVSISFVGNGTSYYDYWATEQDIEDLLQAPSKGREVALNWNGHWEGQPGQKTWVTNPRHYYN